MTAPRTVGAVGGAEARHTPGPWGLARDGVTVIALSMRGVHVARVAEQGMRSAVEPNARLIFCAPDLLDALRGLERIVTAFASTTTLGKTQTARLEAARAAIARATGGAA